MKVYLWLIVPFLLLIISLVWPQKNNQPAEELAAPVIQSEVPAPHPDGDALSISISPPTIIQGEPLRITIDGPVSMLDIQSLTLDGKPLPIFIDNERITAFAGIDQHGKPGLYSVVLTLTDGIKIERSIEIGKRVSTTTDFDIPEQLGGNTPQAEHELTDTLAQDAAILNTITTTISPKKLWNGPFRLPLDGSPTITDVYGYSRKTGSVSLSHNGTDFRAAEGTPVYAMNSGQVVFAGMLRNFGYTIIIDHGLGLMTLYMHLSEIKVVKGDTLEKGGLIALSGHTGYSLGPHLHLSVRIGGLSIDPLKFLELIGPKAVYPIQQKDGIEIP